MFRYSGELQLEALTADQIDPRDIAHSLAGINRFIGQTRTPMPVAWHSLVVAAACCGVGRGTELEALLHDGAEACVGDWIRPLRHRIGKGVFELHDRIQAVVFEAAGLPPNGGRISDTVHAADNMACRGEIASGWGHERLPSWYAALTDAERYTWKQATRAVGPPPWGTGRTRQDLADTFLRRLEVLLPEGTRMLRKLDAARYR